MKINAELVLKTRKARFWSQEELAIAAGLNLRTIQRIETEAAPCSVPDKRCRTRRARLIAVPVDVGVL